MALLTGALMNTEGYGIRKRSAWIAEAVDSLIQKGSAEVVNLHLEVEGSSRNEKTALTEVWLKEDQREGLDILVMELMNLNPFIKWDRSMLVRGAVRCRLKNHAAQAGTKTITC